MDAKTIFADVGTWVETHKTIALCVAVFLAGFAIGAIAF